MTPKRGLKMRQIIIALIVCFAIADSSAQSINPAKVEHVKLKISDNTDRFTGGRLIGPNGPVNLSGTGMLTTLALTPAIIVQEGKPPTLYAGIYYSGFGWAFLTGKAYFLIDGKRFEVTGTDSTSNRKIFSCGSAAGCLVEELARILISRDLAEAISNAQSAEIKVIGANGNLTGRLNEKSVAYFREMMRRYEALGGTYDVPAALFG